MITKQGKRCAYISNAGLVVPSLSNLKFILHDWHKSILFPKLLPKLPLRCLFLSFILVLVLQMFCIHFLFTEILCDANLQHFLIC